MDDLITIAKNIKPIEMPMLKDSLEAEGIESFVRDEYEIYGKFSIGGVKLQVRDKDVPRAMEIFKEIGYQDNNEAEEEMSFLETLVSPTKYLPFVRHWPLEKRLMFLALTASILVALLVYLVFSRSGTTYYHAR